MSALLGRFDEGLHVLRETRAAVTAPRVQKFLADTRIRAYPLAHHIDIRAHEFAQIGDVVHKRYARGEHRISRVLYHLGRRDIGEYHAFAREHERFVETRHDLFRLLAFGSDHHSVGGHEILYGRALFQKLGIGRHVELDVHPTLVELRPHSLLHLLGRAHGNGRLRDENGIFVDIPTERLGHGKNIFQIGRPVLVGRRADGREDDLHIVEHLRQIGGETKTARINITPDHLIEPGLVNRNDPATKFIDLLFVDIHARNVYPHFGKAGSGYESDIACTDYRNIHNLIFL